jgi:hypothetical protein
MNGMRSLVLASAVLALAGCKKQPKPDAPPPGPAKVGHATFKTHRGSDVADDSPTPGSDATGSDATASGDPPPDAAEDDTGKPAYRDDEGHVHGPGGPVFMGTGHDCDASRDHCIRKGVWFAAGNIERGRQFRAVPVFAFEKAWYTWRGDPSDTDGKLYKTKVAGKAAIAAGTPVIFFSADTDDSKWADSEFAALTSSRWEAGVVEAASGDKIRISSWGDVPKDTVRLITESKSF